MRPASRLAIAAALLLAAAAGLRAQSPNWGLALSIGVPMGEFREKIYPPTEDVPVDKVVGYDIGVGGQLTVSLPVEKNLAFRLGVSGMETEGTDTAQGFDTFDLRHTLFSVTGELQLFFDDAYWHRGTYIVAGVSADFERFETAYDSYDYWGYWEPQVADVRRKNRLGGTLGIGHAFRGSGLRFTLEAAYHRTMTGKDPARLEPPASDFLRIGFGIAF